MFELSINKESLLSALHTVSGAVDKKNALAILSNFLLQVKDNMLYLTATDLEIEISVQIACECNNTSGSTTVLAKKLIDIIRSLDENTTPRLICDENTLTIKQGRSSFKLATLPAENYPKAQDECNELELSISRADFFNVLQSTHFALSQQDVRVFLNGLLIEFGPNLITAVGTDGHRMAISRQVCTNQVSKKLLLPKKAVQECLRLLNSSTDEKVLISAGSLHFRLVSSQFVFTSKLIEARFPPYSKAIPKLQDKHIIIDCAVLKRSLSRIVILAHEKFKAVSLHLQPNQLTLIANNNEQEEAQEILAAETEGETFTIGINAGYVLDVLNHLSDGPIKLSMSNTESSILIESLNNDQYLYIIMPMKL